MSQLQQDLRNVEMRERAHRMQASSKPKTVRRAVSPEPILTLNRNSTSKQGKPPETLASINLNPMEETCILPLLAFGGLRLRAKSKLPVGFVNRFLAAQGLVAL